MLPTQPLTMPAALPVQPIALESVNTHSRVPGSSVLPSTSVLGELSAGPLLQAQPARILQGVSQPAPALTVVLQTKRWHGKTYPLDLSPITSIRDALEELKRKLQHEFSIPDHRSVSLQLQSPLLATGLVTESKPIKSLGKSPILQCQVELSCQGCSKLKPLDRFIDASSKQLLALCAKCLKAEKNGELHDSASRQPHPDCKRCSSCKTHKPLTSFHTAYSVCFDCLQKKRQRYSTQKRLLAAKRASDRPPDTVVEEVSFETEVGFQQWLKGLQQAQGYKLRLHYDRPGGGVDKTAQGHNAKDAATWVVRRSSLRGDASFRTRLFKCPCRHILKCHFHVNVRTAVDHETCQAGRVFATASSTHHPRCSEVALEMDRLAREGGEIQLQFGHNVPAGPKRRLFAADVRGETRKTRKAQGGQTAGADGAAGGAAGADLTGGNPRQPAAKKARTTRAYPDPFKYPPSGPGYPLSMAPPRVQIRLSEDPGADGAGTGLGGGPGLGLGGRGAGVGAGVGRHHGTSSGHSDVDVGHGLHPLLDGGMDGDSVLEWGGHGAADDSGLDDGGADHGDDCYDLDSEINISSSPVHSQRHPTAPMPLNPQLSGLPPHAAPNLNRLPPNPGRRAAPPHMDPSVRSMFDDGTATLNLHPPARDLSPNLATQVAAAAAAAAISPTSAVTHAFSLSNDAASLHHQGLSMAAAGRYGYDAAAAATAAAMAQYGGAVQWVMPALGQPAAAAAAALHAGGGSGGGGHGVTPNDLNQHFQGALVAAAAMPQQEKFNLLQQWMQTLQMEINATAQQSGGTGHSAAAAPHHSSQDHQAQQHQALQQQQQQQHQSAQHQHRQQQQQLVDHMNHLLSRQQAMAMQQHQQQQPAQHQQQAAAVRRSKKGPAAMMQGR